MELPKDHPITIEQALSHINEAETQLMGGFKTPRSDRALKEIRMAEAVLQGYTMQNDDDVICSLSDDGVVKAPPPNTA